MSQHCPNQAFRAVDAVLFDLDGTLWDAVAPVSAAWEHTVRERYPQLRPPLSEAELRSCMGMTIDDIGRKLFPTLPQDECQALTDACTQAEHVFLRRMGATLFPQVKETLQLLARKYPLAVISNCESGYIELFMDMFDLRSLFSDWECVGNTGLTKGPNCLLVKERNRWRNPCYVGDTVLDEQAAAQAGLPFIFARYGFGQATSCDAAIDRFEQLLDLL